MSRRWRDRVSTNAGYVFLSPSASNADFSESVDVCAIGFGLVLPSDGCEHFPYSRTELSPKLSLERAPVIFDFRPSCPAFLNLY